MPSDSEAPRCLLCGGETRLLYPSNVPNGAEIESGELACTSPYLAIHDDIFHCRRCGLGRSRLPAETSEIEDLYRDVEDPTYLVSESERRDDFRQALEAIERHPGLNGRRLLEIGSATGLFLDEARKRDWDASGIEPSRWGADRARALGLNVFCGTLEEFQPPAGGFDVVTSWDVWEHLDDPLAALERLHALVRPGGILVITTVNMGGLGARVLRGRWPWYMRMHLHYFTKKSLAEMVKRAGFEVLQTTTQPKTLKLGYLVDRAGGLFGPLGPAARFVTRKLGLDQRPVKVDFGDILLVEARKPAEGASR